MPIVIYGPPGSGKTSNKERLRQKYKADQIIDEWHMNDRRKFGKNDLILTQNPSSAPVGSTLIPISVALR